VDTKKARFSHLPILSHSHLTFKIIRGYPTTPNPPSLK
jgi:hypothetical protein